MSNKYLKIKKSLWFLTIFSLFFAFFLMNYFKLYVADDYNYLSHKVFQSESSITGINSIYHSVLNYYLNWSGRILGHFLTTLFSLMPKYIFDLLNTFAYMGATYLIYAICNVKKKHNLSLYISIHALLWFCVPDYGQVMFWMCGSANYLWASLPVLLMIYVYRREAVYQGNVFTSVIWSVPFFVLGIVAGWAMENMSAGMLVIITLYLLYFYRRNHKVNISLICGYIGALIGFAMLVLAPGNAVRSDIDSGISGAFLFGVISYYFIMCIGIICGLWIILIMALKNKVVSDNDSKVVRDISLQSLIFAVAAIASAYCMLAASYSPERTWYIVCVYAVIAVGILYSDVSLNYSELFEKIIIVAVICVSVILLTQMADTMIYSRESFVQTNNRASMIMKQKEEGVKDVSVPIITHAYPLRAKHDALTGLSDITTDSTYWINASIAKYYGVDSVTGY